MRTLKKIAKFKLKFLKKFIDIIGYMFRQLKKYTFHTSLFLTKPFLLPLFLLSRELTVENGCFCFEKSNTVDENNATTKFVYIFVSLKLNGSNEVWLFSYCLCSAWLLGSAAGFPVL